MESSTRLLCDSNICRLCGQENKHGSCLFPLDGNDTDLSQLVNRYLPIQVKRDGKFPIFICPGCNIQLQATKQFLDLILEGQLKLRDLFRIQQETLQRQEKQRQTLDAALKIVNPTSNVAEYKIHSDESGDKFIIQILSDGPLFPPDHELSLLLLNNAGKPKRKRGRPHKVASVIKNKQADTEEIITLRSDHENDDNGDETRRKRKIKVPSRFQEAVQGKELDRIFREEGVLDESENEGSSTSQYSAILEDEIIGRLQNKEGEELGELVTVSKHANKCRSKLKERLVGSRPKRKYQCEVCDKEFLHYNRYQLHKSMHNNLKYKCAEAGCGLEPNTKLVVEEHQKEIGHVGIDYFEDPDGEENTLAGIDNDSYKPIEIGDILAPKFNCEICLKAFTSKQNYEIHLNAIHNNHRPYHCNKCEKSFSYVNSLKYHMLKHKDKSQKLYACETCNKAFNHPSSLVYHREAEHNNGRRFVCNKCNKSFKHKQLLHRHQLVHSDERPHICKLCQATFKTRANLLNHMPLHTGEKKYFCLQCKQSFAHRTSLTLHLRWHNGQKPYQCDICMKTFSQKGNLAEHKRIHTGEKPFICDVCSRKFTTSSQCKLHMMRHTGERPWRCEYCSKTFLHRDTWKCHTRRHRNERPYQCQQCFRGFTEQWALKKHERLHTGEKPYVCDVCKRRFADGSNLSKHKKIHEARAQKTKPKNIKVVTTNDERSDQQVLYLTYHDSNSNDSQMQTLVHIVDNAHGDSSAITQDNYLPQMAGLQHFYNENGEPISITTADGQPIKILSLEQQDAFKRCMPNGLLLPVGNSTEDEDTIISKIEDSSEEHNSIGHSGIEFLHEDYPKLDDDIKFLTENGDICFVTSYNVDENINTQYI